MGSLKKIYILHGWTYATEKWQPFLDVLKDNGFEVVFLKIPGLTEKLDKVWNIETYVEWLNDKLGNEKSVTIAGHSNGGRIALAFSLKYPEKVKQLILIDSAGIYHRDALITLKRVVFKLVAKMGKKITSSATLRNLLYRVVRENDYKNAPPIVKETMANLIAVDLSPFLVKITTPTLIIWGSDDKITPLKDGKLMHTLIKNSKLEIIDGARHSPQFTHPEIVIKKIVENI